MWTRRKFLKAGGVTLFSASAGSMALLARAIPKNGFHQTQKVLVTIFQRGGMDGLMAVPKINDPLLTTLRPRLSMTAARSAGGSAVVDLDGTFGLHPALSSLVPFYNEKRLAIVHGVGSPDATRSHAVAQEYLETGTPGRKGTSSGWLNRACGLMDHEATPFCAISMTPTLPRLLAGSAPALSLGSLEKISLTNSGNTHVARMVGKSYACLDVQNYMPEHGAVYPNSPLGKSLRQIAQLIKADVGVEVAFAESGGWDTHVQQGTANGAFAQRARDLSQSIVAFWTDLGAHQEDVVVMTMTEFGRTVRENSSAGTDHGRASCLFVLGDNVAGGRVYGSVPDLVPEALSESRDLPVTTDFRSVFSDVAANHLGIEKTDIVFPHWSGPRLSILKDQRKYS